MSETEHGSLYNRNLLEHVLVFCMNAHTFDKKCGKYNQEFYMNSHGLVTESIQEGWLLSLFQPNLQLPSAGHLAGQPGKAITVIKDREFTRFTLSNIYFIT